MRGVGRQTERGARNDVRSERLTMAQRLQLPSRPVERAVAPQPVMDDGVRREAMTEPIPERRRSAQLVTLRLIALIPAPVQQIDVTPLGIEVERRCDGYENNELNPRPQSRHAPRTRGAPCGGRVDAAGVA